MEHEKRKKQLQAQLKELQLANEDYFNKLEYILEERIYTHTDHKRQKKTLMLREIERITNKDIRGKVDELLKKANLP